MDEREREPRARGAKKRSRPRKRKGREDGNEAGEGLYVDSTCADGLSACLVALSQISKLPRCRDSVLRGGAFDTIQSTLSLCCEASLDKVESLVFWGMNCLFFLLRDGANLLPDNASFMLSKGCLPLCEKLAVVCASSLELTTHLGLVRPVLRSHAERQVRSYSPHESESGASRLDHMASRMTEVAGKTFGSGRQSTAHRALGAARRDDY